MCLLDAPSQTEQYDRLCLGLFLYIFFTQKSGALFRGRR